METALTRLGRLILAAEALREKAGTPDWLRVVEETASDTLPRAFTVRPEEADSASGWLARQVHGVGCAQVGRDRHGEVHRPPRVGVTCSSAMGVTQPIAKVGRGYLDGVVAAGGLPVVLPSLDPALADAAIDGIDGLLLTGGGDIDPRRYGAEPEPETGPPDHERDAWELALVAAARRADVPILGICRGAQVLNVASGGTLVQHLPAREADGHDDLDRAAHEVHDVVVALDSTLHLALGASSVRANTLHHQSVDAVGDGAE